MKTHVLILAAMTLAWPVLGADTGTARPEAAADAAVEPPGLPDFNEMLRRLNAELKELVASVDRTTAYLHETKNQKLTRQDLDDNLKNRAKVHFLEIFKNIDDVLGYEETIYTRIEESIRRFQRDAAAASTQAEKEDILNDIHILEQRKADYRARFRTLRDELKLLSADASALVDMTYYDSVMHLFASNLVTMESIVERLKKARDMYSGQLDLANRILAGQTPEQAKTTAEKEPRSKP